ncbi:MAG: GMC family oxidoreductase [Steroidobacteraceae bacterium]
MDHPRAVFGKFLPNRQAVLRALLGRALPDGRLQVGLRLSPEVQAQHRLPNHYVTFEPESSNYASESYQALAQAAKLASGTATSAPATSLPELIYLLSPKELIPHFAYRAIQAARDVTSRPGRHKRFMVVYFCEQLPLSESRVQLGDARDALGQRRLQLDWKLDDTFVKSLLRTEEILATTLAETGIGTLQPGVGEPRFTDASHHMGTTRMSSHPAHGVVDPDCRVHGIPNLFVAGSSIFPSGGHANPTLTIVALALRLADRLAGELTKSVNLR